MLGLGGLAWPLGILVLSRATQIIISFLKHRQGKVTTIIIYVDDMIITIDDVEEMSRLRSIWQSNLK